MTITNEKDTVSMNKSVNSDKDVESKYPLAVIINEKQNDFIETLKRNYFTDLKKKRLTASRKRKASKEIDKITKIDIKSLYALAEDAIKSNKDITHEELTSLLQNSVSKPKIKPKAKVKRKKFYKAIGKGKDKVIHILTGVKDLVLKFYENNQDKIDDFVMMIIGNIVNDVMKKDKSK